VPGRTDRFYLAPFGLLWAEVKASALLELDFNGKVVAGSGLVEDTALYIHLSVHRRAPAARCVLHTHMPYATALGMLEDPRLEMAGQNALGFYDEIAYVDYNGLAFDYSEGERLARALGGKSVLILRNHGALVIGASVAQAFERLYFLERACQAQILALSSGRRLHILPQSVIEPTAAQLIQDEIGLSPRQLGLLFSAFFWSYSLLQIPVGWVAERYGAQRVLAAGLAIWACATMLVGLAHSFAALLALRLLLGIGE